MKFSGSTSSGCAAQPAGAGAAGSGAAACLESPAAAYAGGLLLQGPHMSLLLPALMAGAPPALMLMLLLPWGPAGDVLPAHVMAGLCARDRERPAAAAAAAAATACKCFWASSGDNSLPFSLKRGPLGTEVLMGASFRALLGMPEAASCPAAAGWLARSWLLMLLPVLLLRFRGTAMGVVLAPWVRAAESAAACCKLLQLPGTGIITDCW